MDIKKELSEMQVWATNTYYDDGELDCGCPLLQIYAKAKGLTDRGALNKLYEEMILTRRGKAIDPFIAMDEIARGIGKSREWVRKFINTVDMGACPTDAYTLAERYSSK